MKKQKFGGHENVIEKLEKKKAYSIWPIFLFQCVLLGLLENVVMLIVNLTTMVLNVNSYVTVMMEKGEKSIYFY